MTSERSRAVLLVTLAFWAVHWTAFTLSNALDARPHFQTVALARIGISLVGVLFCYAILALLRRLPARSLRSRAIALALVAPVAGEIFAWISYIALTIATGDTIQLPASWTGSITYLALYAWLFFAWASLVFALEYSFDLRDDELRLSEYKALAQTAKLRALHSQINPHFLFNSLNSLSSLILDRRIEDADLMVTRLANFFRLSLTADPFDDIPLSDEIRLQLEYLAIEQARYPDLRVEFEIPKELENAKVPSLLLQPLVENAIKHGVSQSPASARIVVNAKRAENRLIIAVENFGVRKSASAKVDGAGLGLSYVRERLANRFGTEQALDTGLIGDDGFRALISIPLVR
ncbi:MAG: sensor histidine kinase [Pseudomonadota bacterium]